MVLKCCVDIVIELIVMFVLFYIVWEPSYVCSLKCIDVVASVCARFVAQ